MNRCMSAILTLCVALGVAACIRPAPGPATPVPSPTPAPAAPAELDLALQRDALLPAYAGDVDRQATATRYRIRLKIDLPTAQVSGRQDVEYTNAESTPLPEIYFRLFPATPGYGGAVTVTRVVLPGQPAAPIWLEQDGSALRVPLASPLQPGRSITISLDFVVSVPRDNPAGYSQLNYADGVLTLPNIYPLIPAYDEAGWHIELAPAYGDAVYSDTALYEVEVQAPPGMLIATGSCRALPTGQRKCASGPTRDFMLVLAEGYEMAAQDVDGVSVRSFYRPAHADAGQKALDYAAHAVQIYSRRFGPYPFAEFDVVETHNTFGGIEYPGLVVIGSGLYESAHESFEWVIAHEVAHQWWYSLVGNDQVNHPWLDEALAQYSTILYYEEAHDKATASYLVRAVFEQPYEAVVEAGQDAPVDQPVKAFPQSTYGVIVYRKGALFFHALRQAMGGQLSETSACRLLHPAAPVATADDKLYAFLRTYYRQNLYGVATSERLLDAAYTVLDRSVVQCLYDEWIKGARQSLK